jgi:hypothetical protein
MHANARAFAIMPLSEPFSSAMRHIFAAITDRIFRQRGIIVPRGTEHPAIARSCELVGLD